MIYTKKYEILSAICDRTDHLHLWGLAKLFQESADEHTALLNIGFDTLIKNSQAWILTRFYYQINRMPKLGEHVEVSTWSRGHNGLVALRDFQMKDHSGELLVGGSSNWAVINYQTRKVVRLHGMLDNFEHHPIVGTDRESLSKVAYPAEGDEKIVNETDVRFSSIDHNGHANNSEYLRWICDSLESPEQIKHIQIDYQQESRFGQHIVVKEKSSDNKTFFRIYNPNGIAVNSVVEF